MRSKNLQSFLPETEIFLAGDFNYSNDNKYMKAMVSKAELELLTQNEATTRSNKKTNYVSAYDHIFGTEDAANLVVGQGQALDVTTMIYNERTLETIRKSKKQLSDHIPIFIEIEL